MNTATLNILICSSDDSTMRRMARLLNDKGVRAKTTNRLIDRLCFTQQQWDLLLIDLDGLNSFLRSLLPAVSRKFPNVLRIGISTSGVTDTDILAQGYGLDLDAYLTELPRTEDLIVLFPQIAAKYLCDTEALRELKNSSMNSTEDHSLLLQDDSIGETRSSSFNLNLSYDESPLAL